MSTSCNPERTVAQVRANLAALLKAVKAIYDAVGPDLPEPVEASILALVANASTCLPQRTGINSASSTYFRDTYGLTEREIEVLQLLAEDLPAKEIAARLSHARDCRSLRPRAVETYIASIYAKLGVHSRVGAVVLAIKHNLVRIDDDLDL